MRTGAMELRRLSKAVMNYKKRPVDTETMIALLGAPYEVGVPVDANELESIDEADLQREINVQSPGPLWAKWDCLNFEPYRLSVVALAKKSYSEGWEPALTFLEQIEALRFSLQCIMIKTDDADLWEVVFPCMRHFSDFKE